MIVDKMAPFSQRETDIPSPIQVQTGASSAGQKAVLLLFNCFPFLHVSSIVVCVSIIPLDWIGRSATGLGMLYLIPPIFARVILKVTPLERGRIRPYSKAFFAWWALLNLQVLFCRFPALEETLRLIPGLYSAWLRLWGSKVGKLVYWSAGTRILDRSFLSIGHGVIFGAGVRLNAHVLDRDPDLTLILDDIRIGDEAIVGGYSLLTAGTTVDPGETTKSCLLSPPYSRWTKGKRTKMNTE